MLVCEPSVTRVNAIPQDDPRTDHELVAAINRGEATAFDVLYHRHRDWVAAQARRFTRDPDTALDVLQETFLYLVRKFPGFTLTCQLRSFLYPAVKNLSLSARRKTDRVTSLDAWREQTEAAEPVADPAPVAADDELASALAALSEDHREILRLRFVEGFDLK
jgi:RNA polymerase sigma-70 factor (ECF subfamily)